MTSLMEITTIYNIMLKMKIAGEKVLLDYFKVGLINGGLSL